MALLEIKCIPPSPGLEFNCAGSSSTDRGKVCTYSHLNITSMYSTGCLKKSLHSWEIKTLGTSYSETTNLLSLRLWLQGVLMSTPCCQISTPNRLVVSEYEVPKVLVSRKWGVFIETPGTTKTC